MNSKIEKLDSFLLKSAKAVDKLLDELIPSELLEPMRLHQAMRWSIFAGGKRFRPVLLIAAGEVFGAMNQNLLRTAAAIEMIHTYSLIHDDLPAMDDDELRRGRATCHIKFGEATAILAGDSLQNLAFLTIAEDKNLSAEIRVMLIAEIANASGTPFGMVAGQQMDLDAEGDVAKISIANLELTHRFKTGAMIAVSAVSGAIIAGADEEEISSIRSYAEHLGLLFQITDDILDVTQTTEVLGKTAGKDVSAEKLTYPAVFGLEKTRQMATEIYQKACKELLQTERDFGLLAEIAEYIYRRKA